MGHRSFSGAQWSLFYNHEQAPSVDNQTWNEDYYITNDSVNVKLTIGGTATSGILTYIEKYGFYEGNGVYNEYRLDPHMIVCLLTGRLSKQVILLQCAVVDKQIQAIQVELQQMEVIKKEELAKGQANRVAIDQINQWFESVVHTRRSEIESLEQKKKAIQATAFTEY